MNEVPPGYYPADGDPAGSVREWDGIQWVGNPIPAPPGVSTVRDPARYGTVGVRIGAAMIDAFIGLVLILPILIPALIDAIDAAEAGAEPAAYSPSIEGYGLSLALFACFMVMVAKLGGTPGKLMLGLRITTEDGATTPPGFRRAFMRSAPSLLGWIPVLGILISIVISILSLVWVSNDRERRSVYDRFAGTRVVYKNRL